MRPDRLPSFVGAGSGPLVDAKPRVKDCGSGRSRRDGRSSYASADLQRSTIGGDQLIDQVCLGADTSAASRHVEFEHGTHAKNAGARVTSELEGCVIREECTDGTGLRGTSLRSYDTRARQMVANLDHESRTVTRDLRRRSASTDSQSATGFERAPAKHSSARRGHPGTVAAKPYTLRVEAHDVVVRVLGDVAIVHADDFRHRGRPSWHVHRYLGTLRSLAGVRARRSLCWRQPSRLRAWSPWTSRS